MFIPFSSKPSKPRAQRGAAAVEFAILIVPLLLMLFGVTEYGRAIYQYNTLVKSVRDASRYLSAVAPGNGHAVAKCLAIYGTTNCTGSPVVKDLAAQVQSGKARIVICDAGNCPSTHNSQPTGSGTANLVTVTITGYTFQTPLNFTMSGLTIGAPDITYDPIQNTMRQAS